MKTHFTSADIGKTFATSKEGVTATIVKFDGEDSTMLVRYSYDEFYRWIFNTGEYPSTYPTVYPDKPIPSEADLLRKEIEELKASHEADLRTAVEMAREGYSSLYTSDDIIEKILNK